LPNFIGIAVRTTHIGQARPPRFARNAPPRIEPGASRRVSLPGGVDRASGNDMHQQTLGPQTIIFATCKHVKPELCERHPTGNPHMLRQRGSISAGEELNARIALLS
jgi:hypothetical protein